MRLIIILGFVSLFCFEAKAQMYEDLSYRDDLMELEDQIIEEGTEAELIHLIKNERELRSKLAAEFTKMDMEFSLSTTKADRRKFGSNQEFLNVFRSYRSTLKQKLNYLSNTDSTKEMVKKAYPSFKASQF